MKPRSMGVRLTSSRWKIGPHRASASTSMSRAARQLASWRRPAAAAGWPPPRRGSTKSVRSLTAGLAVFLAQCDQLAQQLAGATAIDAGGVMHMGAQVGDGRGGVVRPFERGVSATRKASMASVPLVCHQR